MARTLGKDRVIQAEKEQGQNVSFDLLWVEDVLEDQVDGEDVHVLEEAAYPHSALGVQVPGNRRM